MDIRICSHTKTCIMVHIVWITKYRYEILRGDIKKRCHELIIQICNTLDIRILDGVVSTNHIHMHIEYPPRLSISDIVKRLKGRTSRKLQMEYPKLKERYWGKHLWAIGYGAFSTGNVTKEIIAEYIKNHGKKQNTGNINFKLE